MNSNLAAFLTLLRTAEGTLGDDGYRTLFGGALFDSYADHPRVIVRAKCGKGYISSSAAGAYQFLVRTWDECRKALDLPDFSPDSQDKAAEFLIKRRGAWNDVRVGRLYTALGKCSLEWASLPGSPYGQPTITNEKALAIFTQAGGVCLEKRPHG